MIVMLYINVGLHAQDMMLPGNISRALKTCTHPEISSMCLSLRFSVCVRVCMERPCQHVTLSCWVSTGMERLNCVQRWMKRGCVFVCAAGRLHVGMCATSWPALSWSANCKYRYSTLAQTHTLRTSFHWRATSLLALDWVNAASEAQLSNTLKMCHAFGMMSSACCDNS